MGETHFGEHLDPEKLDQAKREALITFASLQSENADPEKKQEFFIRLHEAQTGDIKALFETQLGQELGLTYPDEATLQEEVSRFYYDEGELGDKNES